MFVDDRFHVVHTAVANFDVILVEKAVVFMLFREVLRNKIEKCSADVSLDVFTERRVVPGDISLSVASRACRLFVFVVREHETRSNREFCLFVISFSYSKLYT